MKTAFWEISNILIFCATPDSRMEILYSKICDSYSGNLFWSFWNCIWHSVIGVLPFWILRIGILDIWIGILDIWIGILDIWIGILEIWNGIPSLRMPIQMSNFSIFFESQQISYHFAPLVCSTCTTFVHYFFQKVLQLVFLAKCIPTNLWSVPLWVSVCECQSSAHAPTVG